MNEMGAIMKYKFLHRLIERKLKEHATPKPCKSDAEARYFG